MSTWISHPGWRVNTEADAAALTTISSARPPGTGKSMLARRLTTILPAMTLAEALEATRIHRNAGLRAPVRRGHGQRDARECDGPVVLRSVLAAPSSDLLKPIAT